MGGGPIKYAATSRAVLALIFFGLPAISHGAGILDARLTLGPDGYVQSAFQGTVAATEAVRLKAGVDLVSDEESDLSSLWSLSGEGAASDWAYLGGGMTLEPVANFVSAWSAFAFVSVSLLPLTGREDFDTNLTIDAEYRPTSIRPFQRWIDIEQRSIGFELAQTFYRRVILFGGFTAFGYDRDLNGAVRSLLFRSATDRQRVLAVGRTLPLYPRSIVHGGLSYDTAGGSRLSATLSRVEPEVTLLESTQTRLELNADTLVGERWMITAGLALRFRDDREDAFWTLGLSRFFD